VFAVSRCPHRTPAAQRPATRLSRLPANMETGRVAAVRPSTGRLRKRGVLGACAGGVSTRTQTFMRVVAVGGVTTSAPASSVGTGRSHEAARSVPVSKSRATAGPASVSTSAALGEYPAM